MSDIINRAQDALDGNGEPGMYDNYDQACQWSALVRELLAVGLLWHVVHKPNEDAYLVENWTLVATDEEPAMHRTECECKRCRQELPLSKPGKPARLT